MAEEFKSFGSGPSQGVSTPNTRVPLDTASVPPSTSSAFSSAAAAAPPSNGASNGANNQNSFLGSLKTILHSRRVSLPSARSGPGSGAVSPTASVASIASVPTPLYTGPFSHLSREMLERRYQEKLQECERLKLEIESEWARPVAMKDHELTRQQWVSKFKDLQDKLKAAIVDGRVEKAKLVDQIQILEFEKAEAETRLEAAQQDSHNQSDKQISRLEEKYAQRIKLLEEQLETTTQTYEKALQEKDKHYITQIKALKKGLPAGGPSSSSSSSSSVNKQVAAKMALLESRLTQAMEATQVEKQLLLERLTIAKTQAKEVRDRYQKKVNKLEKRVGDLKGKLKQKDLEILSVETKLHTEWTREMEQVEHSHSKSLTETQKENKELVKELAEVQDAHDRLHVENELLVARIAKMKEEITELEARNDELVQELNADDDTDDASDVSAEITRLRKKNAQLTERLNGFKDEVKEIRKEYSLKYKQKTADLQRQYQALQRELVQLKKQLR